MLSGFHALQLHTRVRVRLFGPPVTGGAVVGRRSKVIGGYLSEKGQPSVSLVPGLLERVSNTNLGESWGSKSLYDHDLQNSFSLQYV